MKIENLRRSDLKNTDFQNWSEPTVNNSCLLQKFGHFIKKKINTDLHDKAKKLSTYVDNIIFNSLNFC